MRRDTLLAFLVIILILAALSAKSAFVLPTSVHDGPGQFDATRAKARLANILGNQLPHPADSAADDGVRQRLVANLQQTGLSPLVRDQMACNNFEKSRLVACARIRNVVAALGPPTGKALLLNAHYDSVAVGPGASDDGIGVATLLEVGSILKQLPPRRPVLLLFNEGEELGLVGAQAFLADPLSRNVDSLLNFEARGVNGPVTMFETNQPNGAAIAVYASAVRRPDASSLSTDVARLIPNDTDVTAFKGRRWLTLNSAIVGNETRYHSAGDDLAGLDVRSLQDMGDEALATAVRLSGGLPHANGNQIFFDIGRRAFFKLPLPLGIVWLLFLLASFVIIGARRTETLRGSALVFAALAAGCILGSGAAAIMGVVRAGTYWRAHPEIAFLAVYATVLAGELALFCTRRASLAGQQFREGYWLAFVLLGGLLALVAPGAIIYFLIPPSIVLLGIVFSRWYAPATAIGAILAIVFLYASWGELLSAIEELFSPGPLWVVTPVAAIMIAPALIEASTLFRSDNRRILVPGASLIALVGWVIVGSTPAYSQDHQQRFTIEHVTEFPSRHSSWSILNDGAALPRAYASIGPWRRGKFAFSERQRWLASAPTVDGIDAASIAPKEVANDGSERTMELLIEAKGAERILLVAPASAHIRSAGFPGFIRPMGDNGSSGKFTISCTGRSCDGAELTVTLREMDPVTFTVVGSRNGLPQSAAALVNGRPRLARPQYVPDETVTIAHVAV